MTKVENLYAEQIINESPYYYDESGRLRVKTINESAPMLRKPLPVEDEKPKEPAGPDRPKEVKLVGKKPLPVQGEPVPVKGGTAFLPKPKPGMRALPSKGVGLGRIRALPKDAPVEPSGGMMRTADFRDSNDDGTDDRDQRPSAQPQKKEIKQDLRGLKNQKREMKAVGQKR